MHIHIIGICGTFMGSLALLARDLGMKVTGCDINVYPPMSTQLQNADIKLIEGFGNDQLKINPDLWVIGNVATRTFPIIESILNEKLTFTSGPAFLAKYILKNHDVVAVSGTHGKTTVSSLLAWIFEFSDYNPGFLIGGLPQNFEKSARSGRKGGVFIVEADEYDTAFFDKRSKFLHYTPKVAIINNLEFDHADIFPDLQAIENQFHHWIKTIPSDAKVIINKTSDSLVKLIDRGIWSNFQFFNDDKNDSWGFKELYESNNSLENNEKYYGNVDKFIIFDENNHELEVSSPLLGEHNRSNIVAAAAAAKFMGVPLEQTIEAIKSFKGVKKRMELRGEAKGIKVFDDFAHHPTAIKTTIAAAKKQYITKNKSSNSNNERKILVVFEPRSNSMKTGAMSHKLAESLIDADQVFVYCENLIWDIRKTLSELSPEPKLYQNLNMLIDEIARCSKKGDIILVMSNGSFGGIHEKILDRLMVY